MDLVRFYKVAEHCFCIYSDIESGCLKGMANYKPFVTDECYVNHADCNEHISNVVFSLNVKNNDEYKSVLAKSELIKEFDDDVAYIVMMKGSNREKIFQISLNRKMSDDGGVLIIEHGFKKGKLFLFGSDDYRLVDFVINNAIMLMYAMNTAILDTVLVHASVVSVGGEGFAFLGKSGTGKSTHSGLWLKYVQNSCLLNDDNPVIRVDSTGKVLVYGSPWSGKTPCYKNEYVNLKSVVRLKQAPYNKIKLLTGVQAYAALSPSVSSMKWEKDIADGLHATLSKIIKYTSIYYLECLPNVDAANLCYMTIK